MTMGPEPMSRIFRRSVRRGILLACWPSARRGVQSGLNPSYESRSTFQEGPGRRGRHVAPRGAPRPTPGESSMKRFLTPATLAALLAFAGAALAQEAVTIKVHTRGEGEVALSDTTKTETFKMEV